MLTVGGLIAAKVHVCGQASLQLAQIRFIDQVLMFHRVIALCSEYPRENATKEDHSPAPLLPEIGNLGSGTTTGGDLGWDEGMFKR